ncbi:MAG TPA: SBBP repeat-containing protein, partial [Blastocatellia bacterium]|nr:SBBP repeat-containing protein [Blastocatellia bacterium]
RTEGTFYLGSGVTSVAFVTKLSSDGSSVIYSSLLGGSGYNEGGAIAVDQTGSAFVAIKTDSSNFPVTGDAIQATGRGFGYETVVVRLSPTGSALLFGTYVGGSGDNEPSSIAVDQNGNVIVTGQTGSKDFPLKHPIQGAPFGVPGFPLCPFVFKIALNADSRS